MGKIYNGVASEFEYPQLDTFRVVPDLEKECDSLQVGYNNVVDKHNELADRIEKAIEYIEEDYDRNEEVIDYCNFDTFYKNLLNILKGEDNDRKNIR